MASESAAAPSIVESALYTPPAPPPPPATARFSAPRGCCAACSPPPQGAPRVISRTAQLWRSHVRLAAKLILSLVLLSLSLATGGGAWSDGSNFVVTPYGGMTNAKLGYSLVLSSDLSTGSITTQSLSIVNNLIVPTSSSGLPDPSIGGSWTEQFVNNGCAVPTQSPITSTCRALSGLVGVTVLLHIFITFALLCVVFALAGTGEALWLSHIESAKKKGDAPTAPASGADEVAALPTLPPRLMWLLVAPAVLLSALCAVFWPIAVAAVLAEFRDSYLKGDWSGGAAPSNGPYTYTYLVRPGTNWWLLLISSVTLVFALIDASRVNAASAILANDTTTAVVAFNPAHYAGAGAAAATPAWGEVPQKAAPPQAGPAPGSSVWSNLAAPGNV